MRRTAWVLALSLTSARAASAQTITARVGGELAGFVDSTVTVPVVVDMSGAGGSLLGSYTARLTWDPGVLALGCCGFASTFGTPVVNTDSAAQGVIRFGSISSTGGSGLLTLAQFPFVVTTPGPSDVTLTFSEMSAATSYADLLPLLSTFSGTFCVARGRWGDLDDDGQANSRDALAILSSVIGLTISGVSA